MCRQDVPTYHQISQIALINCIYILISREHKRLRHCNNKQSILSTIRADQSTLRKTKQHRVAVTVAAARSKSVSDYSFERSECISMQVKRQA